nr:hypothetical protein [Endozoicomonas sp.]
MGYGIFDASSKTQAKYPTTSRGVQGVDGDDQPVSMDRWTVQTRSKGDFASCVIPDEIEATIINLGIRKRKIKEIVDIKANSIDQTWTAYFLGTNIPLSFGYPLQSDYLGRMTVLVPALQFFSDQQPILPLISKPFIIHASKTQLFNHFFSNFPCCKFTSNTGHVFLNVSKLARPISFGTSGTFMVQAMRRLFNSELLTTNAPPTAEEIKDNFNVDYISGPLEILSNREERTYCDRFKIEFTNLESNPTITRLQIKYPKAEITPEDITPLLECLSK